MALALTGWGPLPPASAVINPGSIAGFVTDESDTPLAGISVAVLHSNTYSEVVVDQTVTGADGSFRLDDIAADPYYKVRFSDPDADYATEYYDDNVASTFAGWVPVTASTVTTGVDAVLEPAATITGRVTTGAGAPVSHGVVTLGWRYAPGALTTAGTYVTNDTGHYTIESVKAATYVLHFRDPATGANEYWDNQSGFQSATSLAVGKGAAINGIDALLGGVVQNTAAPTISGTAQVGRALTASPGSWSPSGATVTLRWVVGDDTSPEDDPVGSTYTPSAADVGKSLRVHVTGAAGAGWVPTSVWSAPTSAVVAAPVVTPPPPIAISIASVTLPRITGKLRLGHAVRVSAGAWNPAPATLTYQWFARGKAIKGATHRRLRLTSRQVGTRLTVRVTASTPGYLPLTVTTRRTAKVRR